MRVDYWTADASTYCEGCKPAGAEPVYDGEADCPQHCAGCEELLDCSLTDDGRAYVLDAVLERFATGRGSVLVLEAWIDAYGVTLTELFQRQIEGACQPILADAALSTLKGEQS